MAIIIILCAFASKKLTSGQFEVFLKFFEISQIQTTEGNLFHFEKFQKLISTFDLNQSIVLNKRA